MEPFVVRMRERVKEKGPDHVELTERLEKLGISENTAGGNAAVSTSTAQTAQKRPREEEESESVDGESDGQIEDDEDDNGHRQSKLRRITTSEDVERAAEKVWKSKSVKGTLQHHFAEDRCDACKDNRNTICAIKPNSMSCIWCRVKKKKCVRNHARSTTSSKASGENLSSNAKSKGKERESHPQALHEKRAANENRSQDASSSDTDSAQQEEVIAEKRGNVHSHGHPRDATVMRNSLAAPTASAGAALQHDSWLITSISRLTTSYFQRTQRYVQMRARYTDALADLLKAYDNLMSDVDN
ncbi:hypothetical protein BC629DRAFT_1530746 [Irpex lacteus]|nr:hypothetical protein BC629DRAFT_1530746 [Irpex lacteus]